LQSCVLVVPSRHGQAATDPGSHGMGTAPSLDLSVSTIAEHPAMNAAAIRRLERIWHAILAQPIAPANFPVLARKWHHTIASDRRSDLDQI
jgi:hypothetical protein